jgi:hypothetical protein
MSMTPEKLGDEIVGRIADLISEEGEIPLASVVQALIGVAYSCADQVLGPAKARRLVLDSAAAACGTDADIEH